MTFAGQRLVQLAVRSGTAGELLCALAAGAAAGQILVARSGLGLATAAAHLLHEEPQQVTSHWLGGGRLRRLRARMERDEELIWMTPT